MGEALPLALVVGVATVLGLLLGSFLNVCIVRWGAEPKQSIFRPRRSHCPGCGAQIGARDNIPVVSWLLLGGRCRQCRWPIPARYPLVELAVGLLWGLAAWRWGASLEAARAATFGTLLLGIAVTDARAYIIPDEFSLGGFALGLGFAAAAGLPALLDALVGAAAGFAFLWLVAVVGTAVFRKDAMGGGDIKMMALVGAFTGWQGVLLTVFLGAFIGSVIFVPLRLLKGEVLVPFGIFLAIGAAAAFLVGPALVQWYLVVSGLR